MRAKLVFDDWRKLGDPNSIYSTELGAELSAGDLHSGTVFEAELEVDPGVEQEIIKALDRHGAYPVFRVLLEGVR